MEECEALCQRIGILVLGELKCIGTAQHLKNRFGKGYQLDLALSDDSPQTAEAVQKFLSETFPNCSVIENYNNRLKYTLPAQNSSLKLADVFGIMETHKAELHISEYSVGQWTLEQIFIAFAKHGASQSEEGEATEEKQEPDQQFTVNGHHAILVESS
eukprot:TRINITY_DN7941_c0_g1_i4.p1 TRINITY_DN7941_c0_g1~~TRINITY_DN7941_c0_g1_i4.p1  ORF type:complete len:172 (+),score=62.86 TRINITY_DN7941_c0_g1_i4:43-516(+)